MSLFLTPIQCSLILSPHSPVSLHKNNDQNTHRCDTDEYGGEFGHHR